MTERHKALEAPDWRWAQGHAMEMVSTDHDSIVEAIREGIDYGRRKTAAAEPREAEIERLHSILKQAMPMFYDALPDICDDTDKWFETRDRLCAEYEALAPKKGPSDE